MTERPSPSLPSPDNRGDDATLESPIPSDLPTLDSAAPPSDDVGTRVAAGHSIGPYQLVRRLGQGGMGEVWLAEQSQPVRRRVALKLIRAGMDGGDVVTRFDGERQALAMMEHPAIARVYDAGSTPDQRPYFVMEYVDGVPITIYCDNHHLTIRERIELFIRMSEGVQHAHQKAIIHRDLKPSNVLVTEQDEKALPKIIDFGLAKAMGQSLTDVTMATRVGLVVGTPMYMSPEQAGLQEGGLDTRTDVYSLGVIFYELMVGTTPIEEPAQLAFDQLLRRVREEDAPRPSTRIGKLDPAAQSSAAANRRSQPAVLRRQLAGDLDWISLKSLEKDRERRYNSPSEFAADLRRYLNHEPVIARPPSTSYRCAKFVRRHRLGVGFAASVAVLVVAFAVMMAIQTMRVSRERDLAEKNRAEATKQARLAMDTIYSVVTKADDQLRNIAGTGELRKQLAETAMKNLDQISRDAATASWADRTMGVALQRMGDFYAQMGRTTEQVEVENRAISIFRRLMKEQPQEQWLPWNIAVSLDKLGSIAREKEPNPAVALDDYQQSLKLREELVRDDHQPQPPTYRRKIAVGVSANKLADYSLELGDTQSALAYARESLSSFADAANMLPGVKEGPLFVGTGYYALGIALVPVEGEAKARKALLQSVETRRKLAQADPLDGTSAMNLQSSYAALGDLELQVGSPQAALEQYAKAIQVMDELLKKDSSNEEYQWHMANARYGTGVALRLLGQTERARAEFETCLKLRQTLLQTDQNNAERKIEVTLVQGQLGLYAAAARVAGALRDSAPHHPSRLYSAGRAYALCASALAEDHGPAKQHSLELQQEYRDAAIRALREAVANGYQNRWMLERDPDLQGVRNSDGFRQLLSEVRR